MKTKAFLTAAALVFFSVLLNAQEYKRINFAISMQPHVGWIHADETHLANGPVRLGIQGGLRLDYRFEKYAALSFGVNLNQTGGNILYNEGVTLNLIGRNDTVMAGTKVTYNLQYVEVPVALKFLLPEIGYSTWFAEVGIDPMFNTNAFINATDNNISKEPFKQGVSPFNLAWHTGLGFSYSLGKNVGLQFSVVYKNTFLDVTRDSPLRNADNVRFNQVGLNIGIVF